jgi:hypothetical protein
VTCSVKLEFILELVIAQLLLIFENGGIWFEVGNDLIVDIRTRPLCDSMQQRHIESISNWLSNTIVKELRGRKILIAFVLSNDG